MSDTRSDQAAPATCPLPGPGNPGAAADPKDELNHLKQTAKDNQDQIARITKSTASLQQDIGVLEAGLTEIDQLVKTYEAQRGQAAKDLDALRTFADQEGRMAA